MLSKLKETGDKIKAQKQFFDLQKKLGKIVVEVEEGNVKVVLKGSLVFFKVDSIEIDGKPDKLLATALKNGEKQVLKQMQKMQKSGELNGFNVG